MTDFEKVLKKAMEDPAYVTKLKNDPEGALQDVGVTPSSDKINALKGAQAALGAAHVAFGGGARPN